MRIGIISKEAHAKAHAARLEREGHEVVLLGGMPGSIPDSLDALVCRIASSSHTGADLAQKVRRERKIPVIFKNGVNSILREVRRIEAQRKNQATTDNEAATHNNKSSTTENSMIDIEHTNESEEAMEGTTAAPNDEIGEGPAFLVNMVQMIGIYGRTLHDLRAERLIRELASQYGYSPDEVEDIVATWRQGVDEKSPGAMCSINNTNATIEILKGWGYKDAAVVRIKGRSPVTGRVFSTRTYIARDPEALRPIVAKGLVSTVECPSEEWEKRVWARETEPAAEPEEAARVETEPASEEPVHVEEPEPAPEVEEPEPAPEVEAAPVPEPAPVVETSPVPTTAPEPADGLTAALSLLVEEMRANNVVRIVIHEDGEVQMEQRVVLTRNFKVDV